MNYAISRIPIFLFLLITALNIAVINLDLPDVIYKPIFYVCNEVFNTSLLFGIFILLICFRLKLCYYNKVAAAGLLGMNVINLMFMLFPIGYESFHSIALQWYIIPVSIISLILLYKKL